MANSNASRRFTDAGSGETTVIGQGIHIEGEISGPASIEVWGSLKGKATTDGMFSVREGGRIDGEIEASNVVLEGEIKGSIKAREKAELRSTCKVHGDLSAHSVAIAEGSFFDGRIQMTGGLSKGQAVGFEEKRKR